MGWIGVAAIGGSNQALYEKIFSELAYDKDDRSPPDSRRQAQFKVGWENAALQKRTYTDETLNSVLTWNNLGYRFGLKLGQRSEAEIKAAYNFLAQNYKVNYSEPNLLDTTNVFPDEVTSEEVFREGAVRQVSVNAYERDPKARQKCINYYGVSCSVCNFNFGRVFGELGEGFIHVHHLHPISEIAEEYENVLPYAMGVELGYDWERQTTALSLTGNLAQYEACVVLAQVIVGQFEPIQLVFAWTQATNVLLILGQVNFFMEFDVCFYRSQLEFAVSPKSAATE